MDLFQKCKDKKISSWELFHIGIKNLVLNEKINFNSNSESNQWSNKLCFLVFDFIRNYLLSYRFRQFQKITFVYQTINAYCTLTDASTCLPGSNLKLFQRFPLNSLVQCVLVFANNNKHKYSNSKLKSLRWNEIPLPWIVLNPWICQS